MDYFKKGECIVCGIKTPQRCSGCKQVGFCSAAHQKLLWPTHKNICGKTEYSQPPITDGELEWALTHPPPSGYPPLADEIARTKKRNLGLKDKTDLEILQANVDGLIGLTRGNCDLPRYPAYYQPGTIALALKSYSNAGSAEWRFTTMLPGGKLTSSHARVIVTYLYTSTLIQYIVSVNAVALGRPNRMGWTEDDLWAFLDRAGKTTTSMTGPHASGVSGFWELALMQLRRTVVGMIAEAKRCGSMGIVFPFGGPDGRSG